LTAVLIASISASAQKIYSVEAEHKAEVKVFVVDAEYKAGKNDGKWFFTDAEYKAKKKLCGPRVQS
jgi:hypothetical protein